MHLRNRKIVRTVQIILGLYLLFAAIAGFFQLIPAPVLNEAATAFMTALFNTGYMFTLMQIVFLIVGLTFVFDKWSALGAVILAPITVNILLFHLFLDLTGTWIALLFTILHVYLIAIHWNSYKPMIVK